MQEAGQIQGISDVKTDQPPGRILTTPVETVVEAGLTDLVFPHIQSLPEVVSLIRLEADFLNLLEAEINHL